MNSLVSRAAVRYLQGDEAGAAAAATELMARQPGDRRVLHTVVSLAALVGDSGLAQQASRALQARFGVLIVRGSLTEDRSAFPAGTMPSSERSFSCNFARLVWGLSWVPGVLLFVAAALGLWVGQTT